MAASFDTEIWTDFDASGSLYAKFFFALILFGMHDMMGKWRKDFEKDANTRPQKFYRIMNEVPTVLMIGIVIIAVVKPF